VSSIAIVALAASFARTGSGAAAAPAMVQGVLIDQACSSKAETRIVSGVNPHLEGGILWAYTHDRNCLLMDSCKRSGYGVFTYESNKFLTFDPAGNQKALALLQASKKTEDFRIEVTGEVEGDKIKVANIKLLP